MFHTKWWDYTGYFLNINRRICAMSLLFFALAGMAAAYGLAPLFWRVLERMPKRGLIWGCAGVAFLFLLDLFLSLAAPNLGLGVQILFLAAALLIFLKQNSNTREIKVLYHSFS